MKFIMGVICSVYVLIMCNILLKIKHVVKAELVEHKFKNLHWNGYRLRSDFVQIEITTLDSIIQCAKESVHWGNYRTISWNAQEKKCWLSSKDVSHEKIAESHLEEDATWKTLSRKEYTVFSIKYKDPGQPVSCMTYAEASASCHSRQTFLASPNDLIYSKSLGFEYFRCCWLSDNTIGYVLQDAWAVHDCLPQNCPWAMCVFN